MENQTTQAAEAAFVLHDITAPELWQMVRVLRRINIKEAVQSIDPKLWKKSKFEPPAMIDDEGNRVPLPEEKWTESQIRARDKAKEASDALFWQLLGILMDNIGSCEGEVNKLLAMSIRQNPDVFTEMPAQQYLGLIVQYFTREGFSDFFTQAYSLLVKTGASQNFTGVAGMLTR